MKNLNAPRLGAACLAVCLTLLPSCFVSRETTNVPLDPEVVSQLAPGVSTARDVAELLGAPSEVVQLGFRSAWRYDHVRAKRAGFSLIIVTLLDTDARQDRVWVFFDEDDLLINVGSTFDAGDAEYQMPWMDRNYPEDDAPETFDGTREPDADEAPMEDAAS